MKKFLSMLLALIMVFGLAVPAMAAEAYENVTFNYAHDVWRNPAFPSTGEVVDLYNFDYPIIEDGVRGTTNDGSWSLTNVGLAKNFANASSTLEDVVTSVASAYEVEAGDITIHELKDGNDHIAYGVVIFYDEANELLFFIGDTWRGGAGYLLSEESYTPNDRIEAEVTVDVKDIVDNTEPTNPDPVTHTVTFVANGEIVEVQEVEDGKDAVMPEVPAVLFNNGKWDHNGKNITSDLTITAEYSLIFDVEDVVDFVTEIADDEETEELEEEAESNPNTGAPVFAPIAVLAAAAVLLKKRG